MSTLALGPIPTSHSVCSGALFRGLVSQDVLDHSPSYSAKVMNEWSYTFKAWKVTTLLCFYSCTRELYCVKRPLRDFTTFQTIFQLSLKTSLRWVKVHMKGQQGHTTLQGSHAALIGKPNVEGVIDYLHTRVSNYVTGYVMH
jgi:hypothetical protein